MAKSSPNLVSQLHTTDLCAVERPHQIAIPTWVNPDEIARKKNFGGAIELCIEVGGFDGDKQARAAVGVDKAQFSRWQSGTEGIIWPKLERLMDTMGNDVPVLWQMFQRGYDLHSFRRRESEMEKENRQLREENAQLRAEHELTLKVIRELRA